MPCRARCVSLVPRSSIVCVDVNIISNSIYSSFAPFHWCHQSVYSIFPILSHSFRVFLISAPSFPSSPSSCSSTSSPCSYSSCFSCSSPFSLSSCSSLPAFFFFCASFLPSFPRIIYPTIYLPIQPLILCFPLSGLPGS